MRAFTLLLLFFLATFVPCSAHGLDVTTNLLQAKAGSWIRTHQENKHYYTQYVSEVTPDVVTLHIIHKRRDDYVSNRRVRIPVSYIREQSVDVLSSLVTEETLEVDGTTYNVKKIHYRSLDDDAEVDLYVTDDLPATGVLRKDEFPDHGAARVTTTTSEHGFSPDEEILRAGAFTDANEHYGIPTPE
jgi:hypothetical protein